MRFFFCNIFLLYLLHGVGVMGSGCSKNSMPGGGASPSKVTMGELMGVNTFVDDPFELLSPFSVVREYHNWSWDEGDLQFGDAKSYSGYPNNKMQFAPSAGAAGYWNFDDYYSSLHSRGIQVSPCIQGSVVWLHGNNYFPYDSKPVDAPGKSASDPASYHKKSFHAFQFAARYGSKKVDDSLLFLAPDQQRYSGLGWVKYFEDWNEPDKFWMPEAANFSPAEYAAMLSANYDGHCNTMTDGSKKFGVKNADPDMKVVMSGLTAINPNYLNEMLKWFQQNRKDGKFAADVINVHQYCWRTADGPQGGGPAISPEAFGLKEKMKPIVDFRNKHVPNAEVWLSEFGWDTNPSSPLAAPLIGSFSRTQVQGMWLVRAYLALMAAGADKAMVYMLRDVDESSVIQFASSGLTLKKGNWQKKPSWYYLAALKHILGDMQFVGEESNEDETLITYKFKQRGMNKGAYVIWYNTASDKRKAGHLVPVNKKAGSAQLFQLSDSSETGISTALSVSNPVVTVSEMPIFVVVDFIE